MRIVEHVRIERAAEEVWTVVADLETYLAWRPALVEVRRRGRPQELTARRP